VGCGWLSESGGEKGVYIAAGLGAIALLAGCWARGLHWVFGLVMGVH
jgi:hypothetical protein